MEQRFVIAVVEHRFLGFIILPFLVEDGPDRNYFSIVQRLRVYDLTSDRHKFSAIQTQLIKLTEKYADEVLSKKYNKKGTLNDFYKSASDEVVHKKMVSYVEELMTRCLDLIKLNDIPLYFKRAKYMNLYPDDLIELCYEDTSAVFNFHRLENETRYFLTIRHGANQLSLLHKNVFLLVNEPCRILHQNKLYFFDDISGTKLQPFFDKEYISIPKSVEKKYFGSFILNAVQNQEVNFSGFEIIDLPASKEATLSFEIDITGLAVFIPIFSYNQKVIKSKEEGKKMAVLEVNDDHFIFYRYEREAEWESSMVENLRQLGLHGEGSSMHLDVKLTDTIDNGLFLSIDWLSKNLEVIQGLGFKVTQEKLSKRYFIGEHSFDMRINYDNDWFDVNAYVQFGSFSFPFVRLKKYIINHIREFVLPNGETAILPEEWFSRYHSLFSHGKVVDHSVRLQNFHFMLISEMADEPDLKIQDRLKALNGVGIEILEKPMGMRADLRRYQQEGYSWMVNLFTNELCGCLADDMGLGKTIQTLALLLKFKRAESMAPVFGTDKSGQLSLFAMEEDAPSALQSSTLIVLPVSLVHNWEKEIVKFAPSLRTHVYMGARREKGALREIIANFDLILTTYGTVRNDADELSQLDFFCLILDESQYIKNAESKTYQTITAIKATHRLVLTGTPIENSLSDLWAQMNFLNPGLLGSRSYFKNEYLIPIERDGDVDATIRLKKLIHPFMLRRTKEEVAPDLPSLTEETIVVEMLPEQAEFYEKEKSAIRNELLNNIENLGLRKSKIYVLQALMRLRQIAIHPRLVEPDVEFESGKFNDILDMLSILVAENHKILVFSSFVKHLNLLAAKFESMQWNFSLLTGQTTDRKKVIEEFQQNGDKKIFLISLKAGGVGLNLTEADYIFITDPWWNPAAEMQAVSRAHRIGQEKKVFVYRFISEKSIEEKIQKLQMKKSKLATVFVNTNDPFKEISKDEVLDLFE